jgi:hypothetical protein
MQTLLNKILKGGSNQELKRMVDDENSAIIITTIGGVMGIFIIAIILLIYMSGQFGTNKKINYPMLILFYFSIYLIVVAFGGMFLLMESKDVMGMTGGEEDTLTSMPQTSMPQILELDDNSMNLFNDKLHFGMRVILVPFVIITTLILGEIPRDSRSESVDNYIEYMFTNLFQFKNIFIKIGLLFIPLIFGIIELATNGGKFTNIATYYSSVGGLMGIMVTSLFGIIGFMLNLLKPNISYKSITNNLEGKRSNVFSQTIVLFTTIITIFTNMTQRNEGLIFSAFMLALMLFGAGTLASVSSGGLYWTGMIMILTMIALLIIILYLQNDTIDKINLNLIAYFILIVGYVIGMRGIK